MRILFPFMLLAWPVEAQVVDVRVLEHGTRRDAPGVIVELVGAHGPVARGLSNYRGRLTLRAPSPGEYRLRADRVGGMPVESGLFFLRPGGSTRWDLVAPDAAAILPVPASADSSQCGPDLVSGTLTAGLWTEVRKALLSNALTQAGRLERLRVVTFERDLTPEGLRVTERNPVLTITAGQPFAAFGQDALSREEFTTPDAGLLLSEEFVASHCFRALPRDESPRGGLGLVFEPAPGTDLPGMSGTFWLDGASLELRRLEFTFVTRDVPESRIPAGGQLLFRRLLTGGWIIREWQVLSQRSMGDRAFDALFIRGGRAVPLRELPVPTPRRVDLRARVLDGTTGGGLAGAVVRLAGETDSAVTGVDGSFRLAAPVGGMQLLAILDPRTDQPGGPILLELGPNGAAVTESIRALGRGELVWLELRTEDR